MNESADLEATTLHLTRKQNFKMASCEFPLRRILSLYFFKILTFRCFFFLSRGRYKYQIPNTSTNTTWYFYSFCALFVHWEAELDNKLKKFNEKNRSCLFDQFTLLSIGTESTLLKQILRQPSIRRYLMKNTQTWALAMSFAWNLFLEQTLREKMTYDLVEAIWRAHYAICC